MGFCHSIIHAPPVACAAQKTAVLHQSQVFGCHCAWQAASLGKFADGILAAEQHLNNAQAMGVG